MSTPICIFEDEACTNLNPLTPTRPVYDLRCGITSLKEKILRHFPGSPIHLQCRDYLADAVREKNPGIAVNEIEGDRCLFINGRVLADADFGEKIDLKWEGTYLSGETVVATVLAGEALAGVCSRLGDPLLKELLHIGQTRSIEVKLIGYPWHLIQENGSQIKADFEYRNRGGQILGRVYPNVTLLGKEHICIGKDAKIKPGVVLDAEEGPIYISENVTVYPNAVIEGPAFVGKDSLIKIGAKIYEGTSIGEVCKVGGEVEESILHAYSNKQHEGFLGHAYVGEWCNFGADTNNSDLKNNYRNVKVQINHELVDTGSLFVGLFMGDHTKTGINTMFNTGTVVGVGCNVYGAGVPLRFIPSFTWGGAEIIAKCDLEKTLDTARRAMARRKMILTLAQEKVLRKLYEM